MKNAKTEGEIKAYSLSHFESKEDEKLGKLLTLPFAQPVSYLTVKEDPKDHDDYEKLKLAPCPFHLNEEELHNMLRHTAAETMAGWLVLKDGALKFNDEKVLAKNRKVVYDVLKKFAKSIFHSDVVGMSLPAKMHTCRSFTEKYADDLRSELYAFERAAKLSDPIERLKIVTIGVLSGFVHTLEMEKPLNPMLGETCQATLENGTKIYIEQISHHPPMTSFICYGPKESFKFYGRVNPTINFHGNNLDACGNNIATLVFKDGHKIYLEEFPYMKCNGILTGAVKINWKGQLVFSENRKKAVSRTFFDIGVKKSLFGSKDHTLEELEGMIYYPTKGAPIKSKAKRISEQTDVQEEICRLSGSWLKEILINDITYWTTEKPAPVLRYSPSPLPSDWRFREDAIWLRRNNYEMADRWKDAIEIRQRKDRKCRELAAKNAKQIVCQSFCLLQFIS
eukprot:TRINITY_DN194_c0_g1_i1.p1 TRINITY_DN194_c0_g1~~TRINITY_DN194_c0_g1_i1.p1  ORF type:complete len:451 (+),score=63.67 TRINITY_DN194_c0_g1_i1:2-1354(+)